MSEKVKETNESMCRNKLGSILAHFSMLDALETVEDSKKSELLQLFENNKSVALSSLRFLSNKIEMNKKVGDPFFEDEEQILDWYKAENLYNADPNCQHKIIAAPGGGVKCKLCTGWYCS